jgi:hypothetical protein
MDINNSQISPVLEKKTGKTSHLHLFRTINTFLSLTLLVVIITGGSIGKLGLCIMIYLCLVVAIDNLYRTGDLANVLYFFKRLKS